ncbi:MAG: hypothetical protein J6A92_05075 [Lachnospiraceae bacterium]|nr:hypothetical protein [Lachnospiraceae bacterium]
MDIKGLEKLFNDFLDYVNKYLFQGNESIEEYNSERPYYILWKKGVHQIQEGMCPDAFQSIIEFEEKKMLLKKSLSEEELFELIIMKKLVYHLYTGNYVEIAEMVQNLASQFIQIKYAPLLEKLNQNAEWHEKSYFMESSNTDKEVLFETFFSELNFFMRETLEEYKIALVVKMLEQRVDFEQVKEIFDETEEYLQIVKEGVDSKNNILEIYFKLVNEKCIFMKTNKEKDYHKMHLDEARLYQIVQKYWLERKD